MTTLDSWLIELADIDNDLALLTALFDWLRPDDASQVAAVQAKVQQLTTALAAQPALAAQIRGRVRALLVNLRFLPLYSGTGILPRRNFASELWHRIYNYILPKPSIIFSAKNLLQAIFHQRTDYLWVNGLPDESWLQLYHLLVAEAGDRSVEIHLWGEILYALEMLSIWLAAEEMDEELLRLDPSIAEFDSSFIAQEREISGVVAALRGHLHGDGPLSRDADAAHARVMLQQCADQLKRFGQFALNKGSDLNLTYLLERLEQTLARIQSLLDIVTAEDSATLCQRGLALFRQLVAQQRAERSVKSLIRQTSYLFAKSITNHASRTGEHYVTENSREYLTMLKHGLGGGVFIAIMALIKIWITSLGLSMGWTTLWVSLNYGLGFVIIHLFHFTVATKQPAMTASYIAEQLEHARHGMADSSDLAHLLVQVWRSQFAAILGNVAAALPVALLLGFAFDGLTGNGVMSTGKAASLMQEQNAFSSLALFYAAIAGLWLFVSGLVAGYYDNRALYRDLPARLRQHPLLQRLMSQPMRDRFATYIGEHYGALHGNFFFGVMLGVTAYVGYLLNLPLDIRHVAFSVSNVGFSSTVLFPQLWVFVEFILFALLIGVVNLTVSFWLALNVALRARRIRMGSARALADAFWQEVRQRPRDLFVPPD